MSRRRIDEIEKYIQKRKSATVSELCKEFGVSDMTIRRDLIQLEKSNKIVRFHGGASVLGVTDAEKMDARHNMAKDEKTEIAELANDFLNVYINQDHPKIIFLASGSTVCKFAERISLPPGMVILTDNLPVASLVSPNPNHSVIMLGGQILLPSFNVVGYTAEDMVKSFAIDCAVIGTGAIDTDGMLYLHNILEYTSLRAILDRAKKIILLTDHTKFGKTNTIAFGKVDSRFTIITDGGTPDEIVERFRQNDISIITS